MVSGPLDGVKVLDFSTVGPAARCSRILADYGADVIKIAAPAKDAKQITPKFFAYSGHRGMRRVEIDLKTDAGLAAFMRLAESADVIVESFRPGVVTSLGIGYDDTRGRNPRIVYVSTSGYGQSGPASQRAGHDIDYLAAGGYLHTSGRGERGAPALPGATIADAAAGGMQAALAICAALYERERTGDGAYLDVSVAEGVLWLMSLYVDEHLATGVAAGPGHDVLTGRYACYDVYEAADGCWLAVGAIEAKFFANLCRALGLDSLAAAQYDDARQDEIRSALADAFRARDRDDWITELADADTCVAPVNTVAELAADAHFVERGAFVEAKHADAGTFRQLGAVLAGQPRPAEPVEVRDATVIDSDAVLGESGFSMAEIAALKDEGVIA